MILLATMIISLTATLTTRWLVHKKSFPPVRASSSVTLLFISFLAPFAVSDFHLLSAAILGGTLVGMTENVRLPRKSLVTASLCFSLFYYFLIPFNKGFGGALGVAALTATVFSHYSRRLIKTVI